MEKIIADIYAFPRKIITLSELHALMPDDSYEDFAAALQALCTDMVIKPVSNSGRNGKYPPLYMKYHIIPKVTDHTELLTEIRSLHHLIHTQPFLKDPEKYAAKRAMFVQLSEYLKYHFDALQEPMSENERAYSIWRDEKLLDHAENIAALKECGVWEILNTYAAPEPFFDHRMASPPENVLIIENKDTWFSIRKLMIEQKHGICLFGIYFDCVLFGEGKKAARSKNTVADYLSPDQFGGHVYYWGDLDYEGIHIFLMTQKANKSLDLVPFLPAYQMMIEAFSAIDRSADPDLSCRNAQKEPQDMDAFLTYFTSETQAKIVSILESGEYIPQEIINYPILKEGCL